MLSSTVLIQGRTHSARIGQLQSNLARESTVEYYKNLNGDSNVAAYEADSDSITVQFGDGSIYVYTYRSAGASNVEHMKRLAAGGRGLNSFINTAVRKLYASKRR